MSKYRVRNIGVGGVKFLFPTEREESLATIARLSQDAAKNLSSKDTAGELPVESKAPMSDILGRDDTIGSNLVTDEFAGTGVDDFSVNTDRIDKQIGEFGAVNSQLLSSTKSSVTNVIANQNYKKKYVEQNISILKNNPAYHAMLGAIQASSLTDAQKIDRLFNEISLIVGAPDESAILKDKKNKASENYDKKFKKITLFAGPTDDAGSLSGLLGKKIFNEASAIKHGIAYEGEKVGGVFPSYKLEGIDTEIQNPYIDSKVSYLESGVKVANPLAPTKEVDVGGKKRTTLNYLEFENINNFSLSSLNYKIETGEITKEEAIDILDKQIRRQIFTGDGGVNTAILDNAGYDENVRVLANSMLEQNKQIVDARIKEGYKRYKAAMQKTASRAGTSTDISEDEYRRMHNKEFAELIEAGDAFVTYKREEDSKYVGDLTLADTGENLGYTVNKFGDVIEKYGLGEELKKRLGGDPLEVFEQALLFEDETEVINILTSIVSDGLSAGGQVSEEQVEKDLKTILTYVLGTPQYEKYNKAKYRVKSKFDKKESNYRPFEGQAKLNNNVNYSLDEDAREVVKEELQNIKGTDRDNLLKVLHPAIKNKTTLDAVDKIYKSTSSTATTRIGGTDVATALADLDTSEDLDMTLDTDVTDDITEDDVTTIATVMSAQLDDLAALGIDSETYLEEFLADNNINKKYLPDILDRIQYT
tara:strand:+ start:104 stop:2215 length:2112 start_codon:yes stop_codon:yes gene_type:complete